MGGDIEVPHGREDIVYFDALPKDTTTFNVAIVIISGLIGVIIGLVLGTVI